MGNEIAFKPDAAMEAATRADFSYKITPNTISITDTTLGKRSVTCLLYTSDAADE